MSRIPTLHADHTDPAAEDIDPGVQCASCEAVCCRLTVVLLPEDRIPGWLTTCDDHGLETMAKGEDGWCVALDRNTHRCTIYADRPSICRKYAMGGPSCRDERKRWFGAAIPTPVRML